MQTLQIDLELPIDAALFGIGFVSPDLDFTLQRRQFADAAARQTLAGQAAQFAFGNCPIIAPLRSPHLNLSPRALNKLKQIFFAEFVEPLSATRCFVGPKIKKRLHKYVCCAHTLHKLVGTAGLEALIRAAKLPNARK